MLLTRAALLSLVLFLILSAPWTGLAQTRPSLSSEQKDALRSHLERIYYEQDLMIRNQKVDRSDVRHQEQEFEALKVFERIPFRADRPGLESSLRDTARARGIKLSAFKILRQRRRKTPPIPNSLYSDENPNFKLTAEQIAEQIPFEVTVQGDEASAQAWSASWREDQMRLAQPDGAPRRLSLKDRLWVVRGHAFRFREVKFPTLEPRDPQEILPTWARRSPDEFAAAEPVLAGLVSQTHAITPQARPLYRLREQMLLNSARMSFFVALAAPGRPSN